MLYKTIVYRKDQTKLELKSHDLKTATDLAKKYNNEFGYNVAVVECRTVFLRFTAQGDLLEEEK